MFHNDKSNILSEDINASLYYPKQGVNMILLAGFRSKDKTTSDKITIECTHVQAHQTHIIKETSDRGLNIALNHPSIPYFVLYFLFEAAFSHT